MSKTTESFKGKNVLVTGGLGFIGSNLVLELVQIGAKITIIDLLFPGHGGNLFNVEAVKNEVEIIQDDIRNDELMSQLVKGRDFIFHLAGQNDHVRSLTDPFLDIDINIKGSAVLLEACRRYAKEAKLIYTGTRGEYGPAVNLPVTEDAPLNPRGIYELSSLTAQKLFQIYGDHHDLKVITLRLTNIYGPRAQMKHHRFGVANWFIRKALDNDTISVFGDGSLLRDFLYVDDTVKALLACAACDEAYGQLFNVGHDKPSTFLELAKIIVEEAHSGRWELTPFSKEREALEPGDFCSDISRINRIVGWKPTTTLRQGVKATLDFYRRFKDQYWKEGEKA